MGLPERGLHPSGLPTIPRTTCKAPPRPLAKCKPQPPLGNRSNPKRREKKITYASSCAFVLSILLFCRDRALNYGQKFFRGKRFFDETADGKLVDFCKSSCVGVPTHHDNGHG